MDLNVCATLLFDDAEIKLDYSPLQPRDRTGRWTAGGGGGAFKAADTSRSSATANEVTSSNNNSLPAQSKIAKAKINFTRTNNKNGASTGTVTVDGKTYFVKGGMTSKEMAAETKAYDVATAMGLGDNVVPTKKYRIGSKDYVVSPHLGQEASRKEKEQKIFYDKRTAEKALIFDYVIDNRDRHMGNVFVTKRGETKLIDHELSFGNTYFEKDQARSQTSLSYRAANVFYVAIGDSKQIESRKRENNFFRQNDVVDVLLQIDDMVYAKGEVARSNRLVPEHSVKNVIKNKEKIIKASGNDPVVTQRVNHIANTYKSGKTTYRELFNY